MNLVENDSNAAAAKPLVDVGMTVSGLYYGIPFSGVVREVNDSFPDELHGQPAGRRCYIDLTAPIVLDRGKSFERITQSVSAFAHELAVIPGPASSPNDDDEVVSAPAPRLFS